MSYIIIGKESVVQYSIYSIHEQVWEWVPSIDSCHRSTTPLYREIDHVYLCSYCKHFRHVALLVPHSLHIPHVQWK